MTLGGVVIPERHARTTAEHERLLRKQESGAAFFVSQVVYDTGEAKDVISDYVYACEERGVAPARVVFTLSLCGSEKTLDFLQWLGVDVPRWVQNELRRSHDTLEASYEHCIAAAHELARFCRYLGLPFGFNVESVSTRRVEIEATVQLAQDVADLEVLRVHLDHAAVDAGDVEQLGEQALERVDRFVDAVDQLRHLRLVDPPPARGISRFPRAAPDSASRTSTRARPLSSTGADPRPAARIAPYV